MSTCMIITGMFVIVMLNMCTSTWRLMRCLPKYTEAKFVVDRRGLSPKLFPVNFWTTCIWINSQLSPAVPICDSSIMTSGAFVFFKVILRLSWFFYSNFHRCRCMNRKKAVSVFCGLAGLQAVVLYNSSFLWGSLLQSAALKCGCKFMKSRHTSWWVGCTPSQSDLNRLTGQDKLRKKKEFETTRIPK